MKRITKSGFLWIALCTAIAGVGCSENSGSSSFDFDDMELEILDNWIAENNIEAERHDDGYYIQITEEGDTSGLATNMGDCWIKYNITSTSLDGDICHTRDEFTAYAQGTFDYKAYYSPRTQDLLEEYEDYYTEALTMALRDSSFNIYEGTKFTIYAPSALAGSNANGVGGYAGQNSLESGRPIISMIEITEVVSDLEAAEDINIDNFMAANNFTTWEATSSDDEILGVYIDFNFDPETTEYLYKPEYDDDGGYTSESGYTYEVLYQIPRYNVDEELVTNAAELRAAISLALVEFQEEREDSVDGDIGEEAIGEDGSASIWYFVRTLDGFIIDTNIDALTELVFNDSDTVGSVISYTPSSDYSSYVYAWYYGVQDMFAGKWASILTSSTYAYGIDGQAGSSSNTEIAPYTPLLFTLYIDGE